MPSWRQCQGQGRNVADANSGSGGEKGEATVASLVHADSNMDADGTNMDADGT